MEERIWLESEEALRAYALRCAKDWHPKITAQSGGWCVLLKGPLGAGKTTFVRFLCSYWNLAEQVSSPSYVLEAEYKGTAEVVVHHWDVYRLFELPQELLVPVEQGELRLVEWGDKFISHIPYNGIISLDYSLGEAAQTLGEGRFLSYY
jgi:tRNA threonylcarbamoyl adenosine modification protein YjeE